MHPGTRTAKRRSSEAIAHDIIKAADGGARKTAIMYGSCLNPSQLNDHLGRLVSQGFIERDNSNSLYRATQKGRRFIKGFERFLETKHLLAEQALALEEFWRSDDEAQLKETIGEGISRRKPDIEPDGR
ncbi:MAG: winged helix-turn-helix domain-containing protein [Thaumarchaeota archaeon]|nr:winged helix-turn-helix domain-containing protein [Nitrososphaerota archaeon]